MSYTDEQMRAFSQIAYADFTKAYEYLQAIEGEDSFSISELEKTAAELGCKIDDKLLYCLTPEQKKEWKIVAVHDTNPQNGFYGCIIETAPGEAALAFRGSEGLNDIDNLIHDWLSADVGLFDSSQTRQHAEVDRFLEKYRNKINHYDSISLTGHSLGGNLAEYATLVSYKYGFDEKVNQCVSLDGPGFSNEFIAAHFLDINRMKGKMTHYKWSWCGGLLCNLPGVANYEVSVSNEANKKDNERNADKLEKHDTKYLNIDENGNFVRGERNGLERTLDVLTMFIDIIPKPPVFAAAFTLLSYVWSTKEDIINFFDDIAKSAKTVYHSISEVFKDVFKIGSDYFRVDTNSLINDVEEIRSYINKVRNNINDMFSSVQTLNGMWTGTANKAFTDKFIKEKQMIEEYLKEIDGYVNRLENESSSYGNCEQRAISIVNAIRV